MEGGRAETVATREMSCTEMRSLAEHQGEEKKMKRLQLKKSQKLPNTKFKNKNCRTS